jgi:hypothetical protein
MKGIAMQLSGVLAVLALVCSAGLILAGCGGQSEEESTPSPPAAPSGGGPEKIVVGDKDSGASVTLEETGENQGKMTVESKDGEVATLTQTAEGEGTLTITDSEGKTTDLIKMAKDVPDDFPKDFPLYEGAELSSVRTEDSDALNFVITQQTGDSASTLAEWYKKALPEKGFKVTTTLAMPTGTMISFEKGEKVAGAVVIGTQGGKTVANVTVAIRK